MDPPDSQDPNIRTPRTPETHRRKSRYRGFWKQRQDGAQLLATSTSVMPCDCLDHGDGKPSL